MKTAGPRSLLPILLFVPAVAVGQPTEEPPEAPDPVRQGMESLERHLEEAVGQVSVPHAGILLGRAHSSRGYRLPGYGVFFVLTPRALPGEQPVFVFRTKARPRGPAVHIERHVTRPGDEQYWVPEDVEDFERRVLVLQHAAESRRRAAEKDMDRIVEDIRVRLEVEEEGGPAAAGEHDVTVHVETPSSPAGAYLVEEAPEPPWKYWFQAEASEEQRTPDGVVEDVRSAVVEALDARAGVAVGLSPDEFVAVAVDFVPGGVFVSHRQPTRTLIVRARQSDLEARARGAIGLEELRERVEILEY
jgi:hypothetical protein